MDVFQALILGIVQGLTEFLPISSSAHLNIFPWLFNWTEIPEWFDVALHLGTLLALIIFFYKDWVNLFIGGYKQLVKKEKTTEGRMFWYIVISTIPAGILSLILDKISDKIVGDNLTIQMIWIAFALIIMGIVLYVVDKRAKSEVKYKKITFKQSLLVSISQALAAAFPGVSRSGITMTTARALKIDRQSAAKFSFLLATPITFAAVLVKFKDFTFNIAFFVGVISSFIVGMIVIKYLLRYLKNGSFKWFAIYRCALGIAIVFIIMLGLNTLLSVNLY